MIPSNCLKHLPSVVIVVIIHNTVPFVSRLVVIFYLSAWRRAARPCLATSARCRPGCLITLRDHVCKGPELVMSNSPQSTSKTYRQRQPTRYKRRPGQIDLRYEQVSHTHGGMHGSDLGRTVYSALELLRADLAIQGTDAGFLVQFDRNRFLVVTEKAGENTRKRLVLWPQVVNVLLVRVGA